MNIIPLVTNSFGVVVLSKVDALVCLLTESVEASRHKPHNYESRDQERRYDKLSHLWLQVFNLRSYLLSSNFNICTKRTALAVLTATRKEHA